MTSAAMHLKDQLVIHFCRSVPIFNINGHVLCCLVLKMEESSATCRSKEITQPRLCVVCGCCRGRAQYFVDQSQSEIAEIFNRGVGLRRYSRCFLFNPHSYRVCSRSKKKKKSLLTFCSCFDRMHNTNLLLL